MVLLLESKAAGGADGGGIHGSAVDDDLVVSAEELVAAVGWGFSAPKGDGGVVGLFLLLSPP